ncbi:amidohydrolase family protein [Litorilituus lipolyticus]|uniref:amidohydrolase family protein n=1 Tax=Litorilituus lipolyticus TaxID=2491017 RepID=UPI00147821FA|nr:amidohydrolase family protein [Litorilituus lipolyticus]
MNIVDPHIHLFALSHGDYHWLKDENPPYWHDKKQIQRDFNEQDLHLSGELSLTGFVHIEAGFNNHQPWQELAFLEANCQSSFSSIAAINLLDTNSQFTSVLNELSLLKSFKGVRHILDEQAYTLLTSPIVLSNIAQLNQHSKKQALRRKPLVFELQLAFEDSIACKALHDVITNNQQLTFAINHAGFPPDFNNCSEDNKCSWLQNTWLQNIKSFAQYTNVIIKCSGWEMANRHYKAEWLNTCIATIIENFAINKIMLASNFPLCLFSQNSYQDYWLNLLCLPCIKALPEHKKSAICSNNALHYYFD